MNWLHTIDEELQRLRPGENPGRTRTIARRAAGMALQQLYGSTSGDLLAAVKQCADDPAIPDEVRSAAQRLSARLDTGFRSPSADPVGDAMLIISFVKQRTGGT
ncbi:MAG: hypothetical protein HUU02_11845 [Bacteroidetes bacterium]|nr:hypothetical protein [Bacteroidota bacterium]